MKKQQQAVWWIMLWGHLHSHQGHPNHQSPNMKTQSSDEIPRELGKPKWPQSTAKTKPQCTPASSPRNMQERLHQYPMHHIPVPPAQQGHPGRGAQSTAGAKGPQTDPKPRKDTSQQDQGTKAYPQKHPTQQATPRGATRRSTLDTIHSREPQKSTLLHFN